MCDRPSREWHDRQFASPPTVREAEIKRRQALKERHRSEMKARKEFKLAEAGLKAAQLDAIGAKVERATLIQLIQEQIKPAQKRLDKAKAASERVALRGELLEARQQRGNLTRHHERHKILLEWVEQQRRTLESEVAKSIQAPDREGFKSLDQGLRRRSTRVSATRAPRTSRSLDGPAVEGKQKRTRSLLSAIDPSRISKTSPKRKSGALRKTNSSFNPSQTAPTAPTAHVGPGFSQSSGNRTSRAKDAMPTPLSPIHSSKISKSKGRRRNALQETGTSPTQARARATLPCTLCRSDTFKACR